MLHITRHAYLQANKRNVNLKAAADEITRLKALFGLSTLPDGEYQGSYGRVIVRNGSVVTAMEPKERHFRAD